MTTKKVLEFTPTRALTKKDAKIFRDLAKDIETGKIKSVAMAVNTFEHGIEHTFIGDSRIEVLGMASRLVHSINLTCDENQ